ncbi:MAG TPA: prephenate dehydrogenase [Gemmatimonadaceae bacterium]
MMEFRSVAVIGVGLIGGSIARAFSACGVRVLGHDRDLASLGAAVSAGIIQGELGNDLEGIEGADLIVVALPADAAVEIIPRLAQLAKRATLLTDVGSTKRLIVRAAEAAGLGPQFVGSHPLAGDHRSGWTASRADMFQDAPVFLCPAPSAQRETVRRAEELWTSLGATPVVIDASEHDARMAWVSHMPHFLSTALALTLRDAGVSRSSLGPGGRDLTRLAGGSPEMWAAIAQENAPEIAAAISGFKAQLEKIEAALLAQDQRLLKQSLVTGREWFST